MQVQATMPIHHLQCVLGAGVGNGGTLRNPVLILAWQVLYPLPSPALVSYCFEYIQLDAALELIIYLIFQVHTPKQLIHTQEDAKHSYNSRSFLCAC